MTQQELKDQRMEWILKIATIICGIALVVLGVFKIIDFDLEEPRTFALTLYYIIFGFLLFLSSLPCECLYTSFSFLNYYLGKALFLIFLGTLTLDTGTFWYIIISIVLFAVGGVYFILGITCSQNLAGKVDLPQHQPQAEEKPLIKTD